MKSADPRASRLSVGQGGRAFQPAKQDRYTLALTFDVLEGEAANARSKERERGHLHGDLASETPIFQRLAAAEAGLRGRVHRTSPCTFEQIEEYLFRCFEMETSPRVAELARVLGFPHRKFIETFRDAFGIKPSQYLKLRQVEIARLLLQKTSLSANRIAYASGFGTRRTFFREFRQRMGTSPARYRRHTKCL